MNNYKQLAMGTLAAFGLFYSVTSAADYPVKELAPQSTIDLCVAEISDRANYENATRVRHEVDSRARGTIGHVLLIDTTVYGPENGEAIREYATKCVVGNGDRPVMFKIKESGNGA